MDLEMDTMNILICVQDVEVVMLYILQDVVYAMNQLTMIVFLSQKEMNTYVKNVIRKDFAEVNIEKFKEILDKFYMYNNAHEKFILSIDFDGTLMDGKGYEIEPICDFIRGVRGEFNIVLILNTCRTGSMLNEAIHWAGKHGIWFDYINENAVYKIDQFGDCRKIYCNMEIDNTSYNFNIDDFR